MKLTIECICKVPYEIEFEPVDGKVPGPVYCPNCDADATDYANWLIEQQAAGPAATVEPTPEPATAPATAEATVATAAEPAGMPTACYQHPDQPVEMFCFVCKRPICLQCMKKTGFVCSPYCRQQADRLGMDIPLYEGQEKVVAGRQRARAKLISKIVALIIVASAGVWVWYAFFGSKPSVSFSRKVAESYGVAYCKFIAPDRALLMEQNRLSLFDIAAKKELWSTDLTPYQAAAGSPFPLPAGEEESEDEPTKQPAPGSRPDAKAAARLMRRAWSVWGSAYARNVKVQAVADDIWLSCPTGLVRLDPQTGKERARISVEGTILDVDPAESSIIVTSSTKPDNRTFTRVDLATGQTQTDQISITLPEPESPEKLMKPTGGAEVDEAEFMLEKFRTDLVAADRNVVQMEVKLVKANIVAYQAMKAPDKPALGEEIKASESMEQAQALLNEMRREQTGGVRKQDESQYAVSLRRALSDGSHEWTGELIGRPALYALKTVDVVAAGRTIHVFDKTNQKLWSGNLSYPLSLGDESGFGHFRTVPCVERGDTLYFFDPGVLTAFELRTGKARWRLPSVGISSLQFDKDGMLYITTTSAGPESIQFSQQINVSSRVAPVIIKADPQTGKKLWAVENVGDQCHPSGKFLYLTRSQTSWVDVVGAMGSGSGDVPEHFRVYRVDPRTGKKIWEYYQPRSPTAMDFQGSKILLLYPGELQVLKFLSL